MFVFLSTNTKLRGLLHHDQLVHGGTPFFVLHLYFYQQTQIQNGKKYKPAKFVSRWRPRGGKGRGTHVGPQRARWSFGEHAAEPADQSSRSLHCTSFTQSLPLDLPPLHCIDIIINHNKIMCLLGHNSFIHRTSNYFEGAPSNVDLR